MVFASAYGSVSPDGDISENDILFVVRPGHGPHVYEELTALDSAKTPLEAKRSRRLDGAECPGQIPTVEAPLHQSSQLGHCDPGDDERCRFDVFFAQAGSKIRSNEFVEERLRWLYLL